MIDGDPAPAPFVLVHGGRHGGWCWKRVAQLLRAAGHEVYPVTLTGLGERRHLASPSVDLATHIADVVATIECEELADVVLVGHSYGGMVVAGVADAVPERLARMVLLDALVPYDGESVLDLLGPDFADRLRHRVQSDGDGWRLPTVARPEDYGVVDPDDVRWVARRLTAQPFGTHTQPIRLSGRGDAVPRVFVACTAPAADGSGLLLPALCRERAEAAGWPVVELAAAHDAMVTAPVALAHVLVS